jgi:2-polyprenyl-6-methoxyphenol hydroxylase-like FAD-dependent oxidoreductase
MSASCAALGQASDLYFDELVRIDVPQVANGRVVLIGDAASCGSPLTGQGTATALIGAYLLAARLAETPDHTAAALHRYADDIAPFAAFGTQIPYGGVERMVPANRWEAMMSRVTSGIMLSRVFRPLMRRMFASAAESPALPKVAVPEVV